MTEVETFFISFSFYGFLCCSLLCCCCLFAFQTLQHPYFHIVEMFFFLSYYKWKIWTIMQWFFFCSEFFCVLFSDGFDFGEIHFLSCSIIHKIWWETFMKLIFIKLCALGKIRKKKGNFSEKGNNWRKKKEKYYDFSLVQIQWVKNV